MHKRGHVIPTPSLSLHGTADLPSLKNVNLTSKIMWMQVPMHMTPHSAFAAYAALQEAFSSGSSASGQGSGQATVPRRRRPTADEGSSNSAKHACSDVRISVVLNCSSSRFLPVLTLLVVLCAQMAHVPCIIVLPGFPSYGFQLFAWPVCEYTCSPHSNL